MRADVSFPAIPVAANRRRDLGYEVRENALHVPVWRVSGRAAKVFAPTSSPYPGS